MASALLTAGAVWFNKRVGGKVTVLTMKKTFWGYDVREVHETIEYLESQNDTLTAKLANLSTELAAKTEQLSAIESDPLPIAPIGGGSTVEYTELSAKAEKLEAENKRLLKEYKELLSERDKLKTEKERLNHEIAKSENELQQVGAICKNAYADMASVKQQTSEEMRKYVEEFVSASENSNDKMRRIIDNIHMAKDSARDSFLTAVEEILTQFDVMVNEEFDLEGQLQKVDMIKSELEHTVNSLIEEQNTAAPSEVLFEEAAEEPEEELPVLLSRALKEKKKAKAVTPAAAEEPEKPDTVIEKDFTPIAEKAAGDKVIGVSVGLSAKDIF